MWFLFSRYVTSTIADQIKLQRFLLLWKKKTTSKLSNIATATIIFSNIYIIAITFFDFFFLIICDNWKKPFFKVYRYSEGFSNCQIAPFIEKNVLKEVCIFPIPTITVQYQYQSSEIKFTQLNFLNYSFFYYALELYIFSYKWLF